MNRRKLLLLATLLLCAALGGYVLVESVESDHSFAILLFPDAEKSQSQLISCAQSDSFGSSFTARARRILGEGAQAEFELARMKGKEGSVFKLRVSSKDPRSISEANLLNRFADNLARYSQGNQLGRINFIARPSPKPIE